MDCMKDLFIFMKGDIIVTKKDCLNIKSRYFASALSESCPDTMIKSTVRKVMFVRFYFSATTMWSIYNIDTGVRISNETIRNHLHRAGMRARRPSIPIAMT